MAGTQHDLSSHSAHTYQSAHESSSDCCRQLSLSPGIANPSPRRRRSDSTFALKHRHSDSEEREKLRRWAADAMTAPPPLMEPGDTDAALGSLPMAAVGNACLLSNAPRPSSATAIKPECSSQSLSALPSFSQGSAEPVKGLAQRRMESGCLDGIMLDSIRSVRITESAYTIGPGGTPQPTFESPSVRTARPMTASTQKRLCSSRGVNAPPPFSALQQRDSSLTPRPSELGDSLTSNASTRVSQRTECRTLSDPDAQRSQALTNLPRLFGQPKSSLSSCVSAASTISLKIDATDPTHRYQTITDDLQRSNESPIATYLDASGRRSSQTVYDPPPRKATAIVESGLPPLLSHSTLQDIGMIQGLTPPLQFPLVEPFDGLIPGIMASLEPGLDAKMASAALGASLSSGPSPLPDFAQPDLSYAIISDMFSVDTNVSSREKSGASVAPALIPSVQGDGPVSGLNSHSDQAFDNEITMRDITKPSGDLSRRKTIGWAASRPRRDAAPLATDKKAVRATTVDNELTSSAAGARVDQHVCFASPSRDDGERSAVSAEVRFSGCSTGPESTMSSFDSRSTNHRASRSGSVLDTPSVSGLGCPTLSPDVHSQHDQHRFAAGGPYGSFAQGVDDEKMRKAKLRQTKDDTQGNQASFGSNGGLMGSNVNGHFGPGIKAKVIEVLDPLLANVPMTGIEGETINLVEYGCLNSRSIPLIQLIISKFVQRAHARSSLCTVEEDINVEGSEQLGFDRVQSSAFRREGFTEAQASRINVSIVHEDSQSADFRSMIQSLDTRSDSYLDASWQALHRPTLQNSLFPSFAARPFASRICPPATVHCGLALMDLHWNHLLNPSVSLATSAHAELASFLRARANEFKCGGVLFVAFLARSESAGIEPKGCPSGGGGGDGVGNDKRSDIWTTLRRTLTPCIQRLVSCGMLKSEVARHLLDLPLHPRTPRQTSAVLNSLRHSWKVEWSCGLGEEGASDPVVQETPNAQRSGRRDETATSMFSATTQHTTHPHTPLSSPSPTMSRSWPNASVLRNEAHPLRIAHPAWKAYSNGTLSEVALAEHLVMLFKNLYEAHFRLVLRERGKLSKGAVEFVLDSLWDALSSRIDDNMGGAGSMEAVEIEVTICALRRL